MANRQYYRVSGLTGFSTSSGVVQNNLYKLTTTQGEIIILTPMWSRGEGNGLSEHEPWMISSILLQKITEGGNQYYQLGADLNMKDQMFDSIGTEQTPFIGILNGDGKPSTILRRSVAFFDTVGNNNLGEQINFEIRNLVVDNGTITGNTAAGALVRRVRGDNINGLGVVSVTVQNCKITAPVVGGIVGEVEHLNPTGGGQGFSIAHPKAVLLVQT